MRKKITKKNNFINNIYNVKKIYTDKVIIITSTNENKLYCDFLPSVYQMWKKYLPNCIFSLSVISDKEEDDIFIKKLKKFSDDFFLFKNHTDIDSGVQAKISRLYLASLYENYPVIIVDIDQYVFNFEWLMEKLSPIFQNKFISIGYNAYINTKDKGKWPMPYTSGPSNFFKKIIKYNDNYDQWINSFKKIKDPIDNKECVLNKFDNYSDESTLRYLVDKFEDKNYIQNMWVKIDREDAILYNRAHRRIDRWSWDSQFSYEKLKNGHYLDCWPLRPFKDNFEKLKPFLKLLQLDISSEKIFLDDCNIKNNNEIIDEINTRQYKKKIEDCKFLIADLEIGGFGAMVARRKLVYQIGHAFNRTVLFKYNNMEYDECFEDYCIFSFEEIVKKYKMVEFNFTDQNDKLCYFNFNKYWNSSYKNIYQTWCDPDYEKNYLFFSGLLLSQLKIKPIYKEYIDNIKQKLNFNIKTIGLHVRRGDSTKETNGKILPLDIYMNEVKKIKNKTGINRVFVCSDDENVFNKLKTSYNDYIFFQDDDEKRYNNNNSIMVIRNKNLKKQETFTGIKIIELLSSCEYVIGQMNIQFTKLSGAKLSFLKGENRLILINYETEKDINFGINSKTS